MSLLSLIVVAVSFPATANQSHALPPGRNAAECPRTTSHQAFDRNRRIAPKKLGELPPANAYSAVYRLVGGCEVPVVVRYGVGGR